MTTTKQLLTTIYQTEADAWYEVFDILNHVGLSDIDNKGHHGIDDDNYKLVYECIHKAYNRHEMFENLLSKMDEVRQ